VHAHVPVCVHVILWLILTKFDREGRALTAIVLPQAS